MQSQPPKKSRLIISVNSEAVRGLGAKLENPRPVKGTLVSTVSEPRGGGAQFAGLDLYLGHTNPDLHATL